MFRLVPVLGASCGLRQGEIFGLAQEDLDFSARLLRVRRQIKKLGTGFVFSLPKNDKERVVPLPAWTADLAQLHMAAHPPRPHTLAWEKPDGKPVTVNLVARRAEFLDRTEDAAKHTGDCGCATCEETAYPVAPEHTRATWSAPPEWLTPTGLRLAQAERNTRLTDDQQRIRALEQQVTQLRASLWAATGHRPS
jgi:integrase